LNDFSKLIVDYNSDSTTIILGFDLRLNFGTLMSFDTISHTEGLNISMETVDGLAVGA
jgi:hypothetical protein